MRAYSIKSLLFVTAFLATIVAWVVDHANLNARIQRLESVYTRYEYSAAALTLGGSLVDPNERRDLSWGLPGESWGLPEESSRYSLETVIHLESLEAGPAWEPDASNPPVSASDAIHLADAAISTLAFPGPAGVWHRCTTNLEPIGKHWCWVVAYSNSEDSPQEGGFRIAVLMDGSIVKPSYSGR